MIALTTLLASTVCTGVPVSKDAPSGLYGLELSAEDVQRSVEFYVEGLGFRVESSYPGRGGAVLRNGDLALVVIPGAANAAPPLAPETTPETWGGPYANYLVEDLEEGLARVVAAGGTALDGPIPNVIGRSQRVLDPGGNPLHLMELTQGVGSTPTPAVFNVGFRSRDLTAAGELFESAGFEASTTAYLPRILPLAREGSPSLVVLLTEAEVVPTGRLLFATGELEPDLSSGDSPVTNGPAGRVLSFPFGAWPARFVERSAARLTFERLRGMAGTWTGESTEGWVAKSEISVLAAGSVVAQRSSFEAHPDDTMLTLFHMDGGQLLLTHYCVAQNQPRLVASEFTGEGSEAPEKVAFTWLDATGIESRDEGHMDSCRLSFGEDGYSSQWSWYQNGSESWMEEIRYLREE